MPDLIRQTATGPTLNLPGVDYPDDVLEVSDNHVAAPGQGREVCLMMLGNDVMALDRSGVDTLISFLTNWRDRTGLFALAASTVMIESSSCSACKDAPAGASWLCPNRPHRLIERRF